MKELKLVFRIFIDFLIGLTVLGWIVSFIRNELLVSSLGYVVVILVSIAIGNVVLNGFIFVARRLYREYKNQKV